MQYTLTYSDSVQGWVSFYSFNPDYMIGMNNYFYTFKGGNLYRHNVNALRNTFYEPWWIQIGNPSGAFTPTMLQSVLNQSPLENKLFKTINLEGDASWEVELETDIQDSGFIQASWFEKKEESFYAFVRNNSSGQLNLRNVNGIGRSTSVNVLVGTTEVNFSINPLISIGNIISIGDSVYFSATPPVYDFAGVVSAITVNYASGINRLTIDTTPVGTVPIVNPSDFFFFIKNSVAESHGVLGHYCTFTIENSSSDKIELLAVESDVMKSFP
jgi:hypothetical protein